MELRYSATRFVEGMERYHGRKWICDGIIYTDFSKAFDSVPHERLLRKVESYGLKGNILKWIDSFLQNRRQRVKVGGSVSK